MGSTGRWVPWVLIVVALAGAAWWFLGTGDAKDPGGDAPDPRADLRPEEPGARETRLAGRSEGGAGAGGRASAAPRGESTLVGLVTRAGKPSAAQIEVAYLFDAFGPRSAAFFDRMLDASPLTAEATVFSAAGPDGRYVIEGLAAGAHRVTARASDGARASVQAFIAVEGARVAADLSLPGGREVLTGRAVDAAGAPWKGLVVVAPSTADTRFAMFSVQGEAVPTDAEGRFAVVGVDAGAYVVSAILDDAFRAVGRPVAVPQTEDLVLVVDAGMVETTGRVVADDDGSPIAGAWVLGGGEGSGTGIAVVLARTMSDAQGRFRMRVPASRGGWFATAPGFAPAMSERSEVGSEEVEIRMARAARIAGRVTSDGDGAPVAAVRVEVVPIGQGNEFPSFPAPVTTDADGRYEVGDLAPGEVMAYAQGEGWVSKDLGKADPARQGYNPLAVRLESGKTAKADLVVVRGARATGTVSDAAGAPVAGALVRVAVEGQPQTLQMLGATSGTVAATAKDGTFSIDALPAGGRVTFSASAPEQSDAKAGPFTVEGETPLRVDLRFAAARYVSVRVVDDESGAPVPGARVGRGNDSWVTGADGTARAGPLAPGETGFHAAAEGFLHPGQLEPLDADATEATVRLRRALSISGHARFADGSPAGAAEIRAHPERGFSSGRGHAGADGSFRVTGLSSGGHTLRASVVRDGTTFLGDAAAKGGDVDVVVTLSPAAKAKGRLAVRVLGPDRQPVPRAHVTLIGPNGSQGTSTRDGVAIFDSMPPGADLAIEVDGARSASGQPLPYGPARRDDVPPEGGELEIVLPAELAIRGRVVGPDGKGVRGVQVLARVAEPGRMHSLEEISNRTDEDGGFRIGGLGSGGYRIGVQAPDELAAPEPVVATAGGPALRIELRPGTTALVTVLDWRGEPIAGASVSADVPRRAEPALGQRVPIATTDARGVARLASLDPEGRFRLTVTRPPERKDSSSFAQEGWLPRDTNVRLDRAYVIRGVVREAGGQPAGGTTVWHRAPSGGWTGTHVQADGKFLIEDLPAGEVTLCATIESEGPDGPRGGPSPGERGSVPPRTLVQAGDENVTLTVDLGLEITGRVVGWDEDRGWTQASLATEGDGAPARAPTTRIAADGSFRFRGLRAESTYTLWIPPDAEGKSALRRGLRAGERVEVRREPGKTIQGMVKAPAGVTQIQVFAVDSRGLVQLSSAAQPDGAYTLQGLPEGTYRVTAGGRGPDGPWLTGEARNVAAGDTGANLEIKPGS